MKATLEEVAAVLNRDEALTPQQVCGRISLIRGSDVPLKGISTLLTELCAAGRAEIGKRAGFAFTSK